LKILYRENVGFRKKHNVINNTQRADREAKTYLGGGNTYRKDYNIKFLQYKSK
jgi:hypothetical protein